MNRSRIVGPDLPPDLCWAGGERQQGHSGCVEMLLGYCESNPSAPEVVDDVADLPGAGAAFGSVITFGRRSRSTLTTIRAGGVFMYAKRGGSRTIRG